MALQTKNWIIASEIDFGKNFFRGFDRAINGIRKNLANAFNQDRFIKVAKNLEVPNINVSVTADRTIDIANNIADMLESFKIGIFEPSGALHNEMIASMDKIMQNVSVRSQVIPRRTGTLADAMNSQSTIVDANKSRIVGAAINWRQLDNDTNTRRSIIRKKKAQATAKKYQYNTPQGAISIGGYWAFVDQGFNHKQSGFISGREFILDSKGSYHEEDLKILDAIPKFLTDSVNELNRQTQTTIRR